MGIRRGSPWGCLLWLFGDCGLLKRMGMSEGYDFEGPPSTAPSGEQSSKVLRWVAVSVDSQ